MYRDLDALKAVRDKLYAEKRENTIAELAQVELRDSFRIKWPGSRADNALALLRETSSVPSNPESSDIEAAIQHVSDTCGSQRLRAVEASSRQVYSRTVHP